MRFFFEPSRAAFGAQGRTEICRRLPRREPQGDTVAQVCRASNVRQSINRSHVALKKMNA